MKCVIVASGDLEYTDKIKAAIQSAGLVICADGGARHLRALGIIPHVLMGDFDSIEQKDINYFKKKEVNIISFPEKKNHTDSELCVNFAVESGATDITLLGVTGTRIDHTLANIFLLKKLAQKSIPASIINPNNEIHAVVDSLKIKGRPGEILSIIPVTETACGVTIKGLEYPLENAQLSMGSSLGVSNVFKKKSASISIKEGILIVTRSKD